ncbi:MAG TPA: ATP-dependent helicase HrpB, partial [Candidatus Polarisedimenticolaceae bacterium]|nr:ATP-dependent helicase HrpB [Candidatus Polarisedimenticolaceae bacterium]
MPKTDLPICEIGQQLLESLTTHRRLVLTAPTGSGKSTQVPQMLLDSGLLRAGQVTVLQPRRLPTRVLAAWVARTRGVKLGGEVGYQMRLDNATSAATRICYLTEGVLLRRMLADPNITGVSAIVFDEFHERHLFGDITLARALQIQATTRPDLIVVVMSATLDVAPVQKYLHPCALLSCEGRTYPVTVEYLANPAREMSIWDLAVRELQILLRAHPQGDALVFMPGAYEIMRTVRALGDALGAQFLIFPLHGELPPADQDAAIVRYDRRKIIVATNVAETSLTIDGVRLVIDSGLARVLRYDPYRGINTLLIEKISRAAADQRAGRAGRTAPGHCLRLWTAHEQNARPAQELPEVKRLDLSEVILTLNASGINDLTRFQWLEPPDPRALRRAETLLADLGAIEDGVITALGRRMIAFPVHPRYARMLLAAGEYDCVRPVALIAALTQGRDLLIRRQTKEIDSGHGDLFGDETESDFLVLMRAWKYAQGNGYDDGDCRRMGIHAQAARQIGLLFEQFLSIAAAEGFDISEKPMAPEAVQRCVLVGFSDHLAKRLNPGSLRCELAHRHRGVLVRESVVKAPLFVVSEAREMESGAAKDRTLNVVLNLATAIKEEWLRELFPDEFTESRNVFYDPAQRRVIARDEVRFRDMVLREKLSDNPPIDEAAAILAREVAAGRCQLANWNEAVQQWILRVNRLREWMPELELPAIEETDRLSMLVHICHGALSYNEVKGRPVLPLVKSWLSRRQQAWIEEYAPERIQLPGARTVKVIYSEDGAPTIAARIQDLYGIKNALWIARRRVALRIEVLAPSNRPLQVTENLS